MGRRKINTPEILKQKRQAWYLQNKSRILEKCNQWQLRNPEKSRAIKKRYADKNRIEINLKRKALKKSSPETYKEYQKKYSSKYPERIKAAKEKWRAENKEYWNRYSKLNPEKIRARTLKRRASKISNSTPKQVESADRMILKMLKNKFVCCPYCEEVFSVKKMDVDHIFPLSRGGAHSAENVTMACARCNASKGNKILYFEWTPPCGLADLYYDSKR